MIDDDENTRIEALLNRLAFKMERNSEILEASTARMQSGLARANAIRLEQKKMSATLDRLEGKQ